MIGTSLSLCVCQLIEYGERRVSVLVDIDRYGRPELRRLRFQEVECIMSRTKAENAAAWARILKRYCRTCWRRYPAEASLLWSLLWSYDKIDQPRLRGLPKHEGYYPWVSNEELITVASVLPIAEAK